MYSHKRCLTRRGLGQMTARQLYPAIQDALGVTELTTELKTRVKEQACSLLATGDIRPLKRPRTDCNTMVYLLQSQNGSDIGYVGATNDLRRRLQEHNGELPGGARQTVGRTWQIHSTITGFKTRTEALKFESAVARLVDDGRELAPLSTILVAAANLIATRPYYAHLTCVEEP